MGAYGTNAAADAYHLARGNTAWGSATDDAKNAARLLASEWVDAQFEAQFPGYRTGKLAQDRAWPREEAYDIWSVYIEPDATPVMVENATYEVALRQIIRPGSLYVDWTPGKDKKSVSISGAVSVTYAGAMSYADAQIQIGNIGAILAPILTGNQGISQYSGRNSRV